eukprot:TRINITY_DN8269_c0_g1_i2.p2 TRINITY_DN8269_c0_g1~~TRINITY_DN8269_c0_g1_i2.p2  ORF type:complete len:255 (-),score=57.15 TRINITY_DN8269_c0_g1_i2:85-849(-)
MGVDSKLIPDWMENNLITEINETNIQSRVSHFIGQVRKVLKKLRKMEKACLFIQTPLTFRGDAIAFFPGNQKKSFWTLIISSKVFSSPFTDKDDQDIRSTSWDNGLFNEVDGETGKQRHERDEMLESVGMNHLGSLRVHMIFPYVRRRPISLKESNDLVFYININNGNLIFPEKGMDSIRGFSSEPKLEDDSSEESEDSSNEKSNDRKEESEGRPFEESQNSFNEAVTEKKRKKSIPADSSSSDKELRMNKRTK